MTPEAQRIAIAEACGWRKQIYTSEVLQIEKMKWVAPGHVHAGMFLPPDYLSDLNAMHEAEKKFNNSTDAPNYMQHLFAVTFGTNYDSKYSIIDWTLYRFVHATASQRAEAFLRTLNLWKDNE